MKKKEDQSLEVINSYSLSYEDPQLPEKLFINGLEENYKRAEAALDSIYRELIKSVPGLAITKQNGSDEIKYVLDLSDKLLKDIESGKIKLSSENGGKMYAQIREHGSYGKRIPIKREVYAKELDSIQITNALQLKAIQTQIEEMTEQVKAIELSLQDVLRGQQNDRIGLYYSGLSLYLEASVVHNETLRAELVANSLKTISESIAQLCLEIQTDINYLVERKYEENKRKQVELIDQRMATIEQTYLYIHQASLLKAAIYCNEGELPAMAKVLDNYSHFLQNTIAKNATTLIEYDKKDMGTSLDSWKNRASLRIDVSKINDQLCQKDRVWYLEPVKES